MLKWLLRIFLVVWALALALLAIGTFGWFGQPRDPLSGVFLLPLGLPWNILADRLGWGGLAPALLAPAINAGLLALLAGYSGRR